MDGPSHKYMPIQIFSAAPFDYMVKQSPLVLTLSTFSTQLY